MTLILENISHFDFFNRLENESKEILTYLEYRNYQKEEVEKFANKRIDIVKTFIHETIPNNSDRVISLLNDNYAYFNHVFYSEYADNVPSEVAREIERLDDFRKSLERAIAYLSVVDSLYNSKTIIEISDIIEKKDFILTKMNALFSDKSYSIKTILELNNINYRDGETREIAEILNKSGYLILDDKYGNSDFAKISVKGASYITRKNKQKEKKYSETQLDKRIDNIIEHLEKLGFGQEIIFNEIEELRDLQHKLSKKSWSQLLKGKLIDLALDKLISIETISSIYEYLTNDNFKMLK